MAANMKTTNEAPVYVNRNGTWEKVATARFENLRTESARLARVDLVDPRWESTDGRSVLLDHDAVVAVAFEGQWLKGSLLRGLVGSGRYLIEGGISKVPPRGLERAE